MGPRDQSQFSKAGCLGQQAVLLSWIIVLITSLTLQSLKASVESDPTPYEQVDRSILSSETIAALREKHPQLDPRSGPSDPLVKVLQGIKALVTLEWTGGPNPSSPGQTVSWTVIIHPQALPEFTPTGTVQFKVDDVNLGSPVPVQAATAGFSVSNLTHGSHVITAEYSGDQWFEHNTSSLPQNQVVNRLPTASANTISRDANGGAKISIAALLSNDSDPDSDSLSFASAETTSAQGGTVSVSNGWVYYKPATGYTGVDSFHYTIQDSFNAAATGLVTINLRVDNAPSANLAITPGAQSNLIMGMGIPQRVYHVQFTTDLNNPQWQTLGNITADSSGYFEYSDPANGNSRFYRTLYP